MIRRIEPNVPSGIIDIEKIIGAKVRVKSLTTQNYCGWKKNSDTIFTVESIKFRVSIDGKCYAILKLEGIEDRTFKLSDLVFIKLNENEQSS